MLLSAFTIFHVLLSVVGVVSGLAVLLGFLASKEVGRGTTLFLITTVATSATGFLFPFHRLMPGHVVGVLSLAILVLAVSARRHFRSNGGWRKTYVITSAVALYLNVFVLVAQMFQKIPALKDLAPTQSEPPFQIAQGTVLLLFAVLTIMATLKFHPVAAPMKVRIAAA